MRMKTLKIALFCLGCLSVFFLAALITSGLRIRRELPRLKNSSTYQYAGLIGDYAFLQYNQASSEQGRAALLEYADVLQRARAHGANVPGKVLNFQLGLTYLRLYRLAIATHDLAKASDYLSAGQKEMSSVGHKDIPTEELIEAMQKREAEEDKLYKKVNNVPPLLSGADHRSSQ
jgi:hypothetical protein